MLQSMRSKGIYLAISSSQTNILRNADQLIKEINSDLKSYDEMIADISSDEPFLRSEMDFRRKLLLKINEANRILSTDEVIFLFCASLILCNSYDPTICMILKSDASCHNAQLPMTFMKNSVNHYYF